MNGYGNIGRRLATMLSADKEIEFIGVAKYTADKKTKDALDNQFDIYVPESNLRQFRNSNYEVSGKESI